MAEPRQKDAEPDSPCRFPDLAELQDEIARRIRDNRRFLERFMDEDFEEELKEEDGQEPEADPEEL